MVNLSFIAACASGDDWQSIITKCLSDLGDKPADASFGFIYVTEPLAPYLSQLLDELRAQTGIKDWVGTVGAGICYTNTEIYDEAAATLMLTNLPADSYRLLPAGMDALVDTLSQNKQWLSDEAVHFGIVHGDPRNTHIAQLIESLSAELDPGFLVGGLTAAGDQNFQQQIAGELYEDGLSGVILSSHVNVISGLTQGCTPMPERHTITRSEGNIVAELDGKPALDVFKEDIGETLANDLSRVAGTIYAGLPVSGSDTGDYLVRNIIGIDPEEKLIAIGDNMEDNIPLMFCLRDSDTARDDMVRMLSDLKKRATGPIKGGLYYSCLGRGRYQFGENAEEMKLISEHLGDFPLVGFFANGEISHNRLYGYTGVLTLFI